MDTPMLTANPLAQPLVDVLRELRHAKNERQAYRELFLLSLGLLGESEQELRTVRKRLEAFYHRTRNERQRAA
jgi:hypothetical protein